MLRTFFSFVFKQEAHPDLVYLRVSLINFADRLVDFFVFCRVARDIGTDTLSVERVLARVHKELTVVKDCSIAYVAVLGRVNRYVSVLLMSSLRSQKLRVLRMLLDLSPEIFDLFLVVIETIAKMFFHVFDFSLLRE